MKYISKLIILFLLSVFGAQPVWAQGSIDANRMNRDINIMENILQELFKTRWAGKGSSVHVAPSGSFSIRGSYDIRGTYLPGYGIIFTIPGRSSGFMMLSGSDDSESYSYSFQYSDDESSQKEVTEESITNRIKEFLMDYGSTIGQLGNDDRIMVIYNTRSNNREWVVFSSSATDENKKSLPTISVVAKKSDLQAYRNGSISENELDSRLSVSTVEADEKEQLDLKVMANIFETALKEQEAKSFRISGSVNYLNLDNFGALFFFDARYASGSFFFKAPRISEFSFGEEEQARVEVKSVIEDKLRETNEKQQENAEEIRKSYEAFITNIKEYLVDYGRTLSSVNSNQHIMISATISSSVEDIPERVDIQVKKSVLEAMDKGSMSRENAIKQVVVREY